MDEGSRRASWTGILAAERDCCSRLAAVVAAERRAAIERDLPALLAAVKEREVLQAQWERAAARHAALAAEAGPLASVAAQDAELAALRDGVRSAALDLARAQRTNAAIVRGALAQLGDLLATLKRGQPGSSYDGRAALTAPLPSAAGAGWNA
jgi:flagellar biosynthesis/type III secretory pathway chaperone